VHWEVLARVTLLAGLGATAMVLRHTETATAVSVGLAVALIGQIAAIDLTTSAAGGSPPTAAPIPVPSRSRRRVLRSAVAVSVADAAVAASVEVALAVAEVAISAAEDNNSTNNINCNNEKNNFIDSRSDAFRFAGCTGNIRECGVCQ